MPIGKWLRGEMKDYARDLLLSARAAERGLFQPAVVEKYLTEHATGQADRATQLWTLLMLELWFRSFIDG